MTVNYYDAIEQGAGAEGSSFYEGRVLTFEESVLVHKSGNTGGFVNKGDPCVVGDIVGIAMSTALAATDPIAIDTEGIWYLTVYGLNDAGSSAVAVGNRIYINRTTAVLSKIADPATNIPFGESLGVVNAGSSAVCAVKVHQDPPGALVDLSIIVVSTRGSDSGGDGSWANPYASLTKALTVVSTTRKTIFMLPGDYAEAAVLTWPNVNGLLIKGLDESGQVVITNTNAAAEVMIINPTFTSATFEAFLESVCIEHAAQIGLEIDNANMGTRKLLIHLTDVSFSQVSTGKSINVTHTLTTQAIRIYAKRCDEVEGLTNIVVTNADDRFRFEACTLIGGLTTNNGGYAAEITLLHCVVLTSGLTIGSATQVLTYVGSCYRTDAGVYSQLADTYSS